MTEVRTAPGLRGLESQYEILGELRGHGTARHYIGTTRGERPAEVAIVVAEKAEGADSADLAHFAADAQLLMGDVHPTILRVLESRWIGPTTIAIVSERAIGETLGELLERGERFSNPRVAMILRDVAAALEWARDHGVVHRGVTPDTLVLERDTDRARVSFVPTRIPITGIPDATSDAQTIAMLAWAFLSGDPQSKPGATSLGEAAPNLAARVVESTDRILSTNDHADAPDVATYLGILAAGDVLKQAEVELIAQKEEYDEAHRIELQKCELKRQEIEDHAAEQAAILAGEREEFQRQIADERAALEAERARFEAMMAERKERFAQVRAELDQQRAEMERRVAELEQYRAEVEKVRADAVAVREEAKAARADARAAAAKAAEAAAAHSAAVRAANEAAARAARDAAERASAQAAKALDRADEQRLPVLPVAPTAEAIEHFVDEPIDIPDLESLTSARLAKPPKVPKWQKFEPVDLDRTDEEAINAGAGRPRWMIPVGIATLVVIIAAAIIGMIHRRSTPANSLAVGSDVPAGRVPRGGFLTQSAGGNVAPRFVAPAPDSTALPTAAEDSIERAQATADSIAEAREARAARARRAAREEEQFQAEREAQREAQRAAQQAEMERQRALRPTIDSIYGNPNVAIDSTYRPDTAFRRDTIRPEAIIRHDTMPRRDSVIRTDTTFRRDTILPPPIRPRPDTLRYH